MNECIRDDITECDCPSCSQDDLEWEHVQGWHVDHAESDCQICVAERDEVCE